MKIGSKKTCIHGNFGSSPAEPAPSDSGGWSRSFAYDQYGNMWVTGAQGVGMSGNMPTMDSFTNKNQINYLSYDAAGNLLSATGDTVTYDAENRLTSAYDTVTHNTETYLYDGAGQRVEKSGPGGTAVYVYDAFGQLAAEYSTTQNTSPCTTCYLSYDYLGSVRLVTDQNGNVVARHDYLPFGEEVPANTAGRNSDWGSITDVEQKFTGQIRDNETGMDYFNARYFSNALGRFNSADPGNAGADLTDPQTWNGYGYVMNNPVALVDPSGAQWRTVDVEVCTPAVSSSVSFIPINPYGIPGGSSALCHYETQWVWYPDPGSTGSTGGGGGTPPSQPQVPSLPLPSMPTPPSYQTCVAGYGAAGAVWGGRAGWLGGGAAGILGSETGPFDIAIAYGGKVLTSAVGTYAGLRAGQLLGNVFCASSTGSRGGGGGSNFGDNQRQNKQANDARQAAERITGKRFTPAQERKFHDAITGQGLGYHDLVEIAVEVLEGRI